MDSFASRRRAAKPRLSRLSSITRAEDLLALAGGPDPSGSDTDGRPVSSDVEGTDGALYTTLSDVVVSTTPDEYSYSEDSEELGSRSASLNKDGTASGATLVSRRSGTGRVSKGLSSSSDDFDGYLSRSSAAGSMCISPWRTTSDSEALDTTEYSSTPAATGSVRYLGKTAAQSKPAPLTDSTQPDSAHHLGKIPLTSLAPIAETAVAAFPTQTATQAPHELAPVHSHKPAGFTDSVSPQPGAFSKDAGGKIPNLHIKGASPSLERRISMSDPFFMPDSPSASASSPRIRTWDKGQASDGSDVEPEEESVWGRRMARIGSSKPRPTLDLAQVDLHPTLHEQGATSLTKEDMQQLGAAVDSVLQVGPNQDGWENLGDGQILPGESHVKNDPKWATAVTQRQEPWAVLGAARFQRRLEDDGRHGLSELDMMDPATRAALSGNRGFGGAGAVSIVQRSGTPLPLAI